MINFKCVILFTIVASAPTNLMAIQKNVTNIRLSWTPPSPLGATTGYRIYYSNSSSSDSVDVSGGSTDNYLLTDLQNEDNYTIFILATSEHFFSNISQAVILSLGESLHYHRVQKIPVFVFIFSFNLSQHLET